MGYFRQIFVGWVSLLVVDVIALADGMDMKPRSYPVGPSDCSSMEVFDLTMGMCAPYAMEGMPMSMTMLSGNTFGVATSSSGPRGRDRLASPNMFMFDYGRTLGSYHYLSVDVMATFEKWTLPKRGYPELLQIGEANENGEPFLDAQHPHSSPLMGVTLSDLISLGGEKNFLKIFFAPRGETTDGPIAFMHRPTGVVNPDAPLGHHIGQDVGHISSTVIGTELILGASQFQFSVFNGAEPEPTKVDLPMGAPRSSAFRFIHEFSSRLSAMASVALVKEPEGDAGPDHVWRFSGSLYTEHNLENEWKLQSSLIYGNIRNLDGASSLSSVGQEFLLKGVRPRIWSRIEVLQRTPGQLQIAETENENRGYWITAATLGYSHAIAQKEEGEIALGTSVTHDFLPNNFEAAYGGDPWTAKAFLQVRGSLMW